MKKLVLTLCIILVGLQSCVNNDDNIDETVLLVDDTLDIREGDIIFQSSEGGQSDAVKLATCSKYSHVGVIMLHDGKWVVCEAKQPVMRTSLVNFIKSGKGDDFTISRYIGDLNDCEINEMKKFYNKYHLSKYDFTFSWTDKRMYCSELVWKMYDAAGIKISDQYRFNDLDLTSPETKKLIKQRRPNGIDYDESIVTPINLYNSVLTFEVYTTYK
jgi:hypothetical protein